VNSESLPTAAQLSSSRLKQWHQNGEALLTFENTRSWINAAGIALYIPRHAQLVTPAPSMVEAVLGSPCAAPAVAQLEQSRELLVRLIAEGVAVPLNLFGSPSGAGIDTPDFIVATAVLPYIFTLRGDKGWKVPPPTSGVNKVSPLALNTYNLLAERVKDAIPGLSASALATLLGKEVTESGVLRALTELWQHLRVLPIPQPDGQPTLWELTSARFTKQLKAGGNAGQPSALSALISLYLGQSLLATEDDIEIFLSPLAARSRVRDVIHALIAARQLETLVIDGKTCLHVAGELPAFLSEPVKPLEVEMAVPVDDIDHLVVTTEGHTHIPVIEDDGPIKKFVPRPRKIGTGFVTKPGLDRPARKPFSGERKPFDARPDRERRPFNRDRAGQGKPFQKSFDKPWQEKRLDRLAASSAPSDLPDDAAAAPSSEEFGERPFTNRPPRKPAFGKRPFGEKREFGGREKRSFSGERRSFGDGERRSFSGKPGFKSRPRPEGEDASGETERPRYRKFDAPRGARPFTKKPGGYKPKSSEGESEGYKGRSGGGYKRSEGGYKGRAEGGYKPRSESGFKSRSEGGYKRKSEGGYKPRSEGGYKGKSEGGYKGRSEGGFKSAGYKGKSEGGYKPRSESGYKGKSEGGYKGKSEGGFKSKGYKGKSEGGYKSKGSSDFKSKSFGSSAKKPGKAGPFDKFKGDKKPFKKRKDRE
jgi:hypothetical protein